MESSITSIEPPLVSKAILFYDGDCSLCSFAVSQLSRLGLLTTVAPIPWGKIACANPEVAKRIHQEIIIWFPETTHYLGGIDVVILLLSSKSQYKWLAWYFSLPVIKLLLHHLYMTLSMNRRLLAPTQKMNCACEPPFHLGYRIVFWVLLTVLLLGGFAAICFSAKLLL